MSSVISASTTTQSSLPVIFLAKESNDSVKEKADPDATWHFYSHSIKRDTKNLKLHMYRVFFAMQYKNGSFLSGSLHDLFYVLKDAGEPLRMRLLKASVPYLDNKEINFFVNWIKTFKKSNYEHRWVTGSVLATGLLGADHRLVTKGKNEKVLITPLEEAKAFIEYGQLDLAKKTLEEALIVDSDNKALREELDALQQYETLHEGT